MNDYSFDQEALDEYEQTAVYYEERREGLGARFVNAFERAVKSAIDTPDAGAQWPGLPSEAGIRRRSILGFPAISLAYTIINDRLQILAVVHARRRPGYWFHRLHR